MQREKGVGALYEKLHLTKNWHFNAFSGTQLIFSQAGTSAAFLWVPFPFGILLTFGKENTFSLLSLNRKILSPPKEMEQKNIKVDNSENINAVSVVFLFLC